MLQKLTKILASVMLGVLFALGVGTAANAYTQDDAESVAALSSTVYEEISSNKYEADGGGTKSSLVPGSKLFTKDEETGVYQINEKELGRLSTKGRDKLADDVAKASNKAVADNEGNENSLIDSTAKSNWIKDLSKSNGFGTRVMSAAQAEWHPDFDKAAEILKPFNGFISTLMGLGAILIMSLLGLQVVAEVLFITIPATRGIFGGTDTGVLNGGEKSVIIKGLVSGDARKAVETSDQLDSKALFRWAGYTFVKFIAVAFIMVFFVTGQIWPFINGLTDCVYAFTH